MPQASGNSSGDAGRIHIFLDIDGVVADFDAHAAAQGKYTADKKVKWDELDYQWWVTMPACAGAKDFYDTVKNMGIVKFLTAPVPSTDCFRGKADWVQNFIPERGRFILNDLIVCPSADKNYLAKPGHILIDDREKNVQEWIAAGGVGIWHKGDFKETMKELQAAIAKLAVPVTVRPRLIAIGGMSGSGKTTLGDSLLKDVPNSISLDADRVRKEMLGVSEATHLPPEAYSTETRERLIAEMNSRVKQGLAAGKNVIISTAFLSPAAKAGEEKLALESNAQFTGLWLETDLSVLFDRVAARTNNPSDAGVDVVRMQQQNTPSAGGWSKIDAGQSPENVVREALGIIQKSASQQKPGQSLATPKI